MTESLSVTRAVLIALALVALALVLWKTSQVAIVTFGGVVGAAGWRGLAVPLARRTRLGERTCIAIVIAVMALALGAAAWLFGAQASEQVNKLQSTLPEALQGLLDRVEATDTGRSMVESVKESLTDSSVFSRLGLAAGALVGGATDLVLMLFLSIYLALSPHEYVEGFLRLLPPKRRPQVRRALQDAGAALQRWLMAQLVAMGIVGVAVGIGLGVLGIPMALVLGLMAGLLEFIPVVGPVLFAIPGLLVASTQGTQTVLLALGLYVIVQTLESNVLVPLLQKWAVRLPPVISLVAALAGVILFGPIGLLFASPLAVVVMALVQHLYVEETLENHRGGAAEKREHASAARTSSQGDADTETA